MNNRPERINPDTIAEADEEKAGLLLINIYYSYLCEIRLTSQFAAHKNQVENALKVINCIRFIKVNEAYLLYAYENRKDKNSMIYTRAMGAALNGEDKDKQIIRDFGGTAIDLLDVFKTPQELMAELNGMIKKVEFAIQRAMEREELLVLTDKFLYEETTGCFDKRVGNVLAYATKLETAGKDYILPFEDLLKQVMDKLGESKDEQTNFQAIFQHFKPYFGKKICYEKTKEIVLSQDFIIEYMEKIFLWERKYAIAKPITTEHNTTPTITAARALELIKNYKALIKVVSSPIESKNAKVNNLNNPDGWNYNLNILMYPVEYRPYKSARLMNRKTNRNRRWNPYTNQYEDKTNIRADGKRGPGNKSKDWKHSKKEPTSLLPSNGKMRFYEYVKEPVGLLFDLDQCLLKKDSAGRVKYVWKTNAATNFRWWLEGNQVQNGRMINRVPWISIEELIEELENHVKQGIIPKHNEILACLCLDSLVLFSPIDLPADRLNALRRKFLIKAMTGKEVAVLVITPNTEPREYDTAAQVADIRHAMLQNKNSRAAQMLADILSFTKDTNNPEALIRAIQGAQPEAKRQDVTPPKQPAPAPISPAQLQSDLDELINNSKHADAVTLLNNFFYHHPENQSNRLYQDIGLIYAIKLKQNDLAKLLLEKGANPNYKHNTQKSSTPALILAMRNHLQELVNLMLKRPLTEEIIKRAILVGTWENKTELVLNILKLYPTTNVNRGAFDDGSNAIQCAVLAKNVALVEALCKHGAQITMRTAQFKAPIDIAFEDLAPDHTKNEILQTLVTHSSPALPFDKLNQLLAYAVHNQLPELAETLLQRKANPNYRESKDASSLFYIALCSSLNLIMIAPMLKTNPTIETLREIICEVLDSEQSTPKVIRLLFHKDFPKDKLQSCLNHALYHAVTTKKTETAKQLLLWGASPDYVAETETESVFVLAVRNNEQTLIAPMLVLAQSLNKKTLAHAVLYGASHNYTDCVIPILTSAHLFGVDDVRMTNDGTMAIHWAVKFGNLPLVEALCRRGASPTAQTLAHKTPVMMTLESKHENKPAILEILLKNAKEPIPTEQLNSILLFAVNNRHTQLAVSALSKGASPNYCASYQADETVLWLALSTAQEAVVTSMLRNNPSLDTLEKLTKKLIRNNQINLLLTLLANPAFPKHTLTIQLNLILSHAISTRDTNLAKTVLKQGAKPDGAHFRSVIDSDQTVLLADMIAAGLEPRYLQTEILNLTLNDDTHAVLKLLALDNIRISLNVQRTDNGATALHCATSKGNLQLATAFVNYGADVTLHTKTGKTAFDLARESTHRNRRYLMNALMSSRESSIGLNNQERAFKAAKSDCLDSIRAYITKRELERAKQKSEYHLWGRLFRSISATTKISAAKKLRTLITTDEIVVFNENEIKALKEARLGRIVAKYQKNGVLPVEYPKRLYRS